MILAPCDAAGFGPALELIDRVFLRERGIPGSLRDRFPSVIDAARPENLWSVRKGDRTISVLALRRFVWQPDGAELPAAMIGMVATDPSARGRGMAGALLREATRALAREGRMFAVLWADRPGIYARMGWIAADCGLGAELPGAASTDRGSTNRGDGVHVTPIPPLALHARHGARDIHRDAAAWHTLPPHADRLEYLVTDDGYAFVGVRDTRAHVYEIAGSTRALPALFSALRGRYERTRLNGRRGGAWEDWAARHASIDWAAQSLAMWLPLAPQMEQTGFARWYLPFPDRI